MDSPFKNQNSEFRIQNCAGGFTLMELLIVMMIMTLIAGLALSALAGAAESAREQRTRAIITKIDQLIMERYESYRTRPVPVRVPPNFNGTPVTPRMAAQVRLYALRELMRMEMPDRISDLCTDAELNDLSNNNDDTLNAIADRNNVKRATLNMVSGFGAAPQANNTYLLASIPSVARSYKRQVARASSGWTILHQSSECLYLILSSMQDGDKSAIDYFSSSEIADTDGDGMNEILDAWGTPIAFLRWAPGYSYGDSAAMTTQAIDSPDPFDPVKSDPRWQVAAATHPFALRPLIVSAGRDRAFDLDLGTVIYANTTNMNSQPQIPPTDPYYSNTPGGIPAAGQVLDTDNDGIEYADNITNHFVQTP